MRRRSPGYGQLLGVGIDISGLGLGVKAIVAPIQDIDLFVRYRTLVLVHTISTGLDYYPLAVVSRSAFQLVATGAYHWMRFSNRISDGVGAFPPALNAAFQAGNLGKVRAGFVSVGGGVSLRTCGGFQLKLIVSQLIQAPNRSRPYDGQSFAFRGVRLPNVGLEFGGYFQPFHRAYFQDRACGRQAG
ncbi:MAG: hypothetical protein B7733_24280 [Myxococcales bacterium FL481]|nr:MAG: hypothetical protein B7733_24280 [Myxococcales bacterium FL481]